MYSREINNQEVRFGTTGYTLNKVFILFDRETNTVWYPGKNDTLNAVGGRLKGNSIPVSAKNEMMPLGQWLEKHPDSKILLPPPVSKTIHDSR